MWPNGTGRGVRVAVVDSGIHAAHPHVRGRVGGISIAEDGEATADIADLIGHGTAVSAAIREKARDAEIYSVKVFGQRLAAPAARVARGIRLAADAGADIINLSLGTRTREHAPLFAEAIAHAAAQGALVVAAAESDGEPWLPGSLPGVVAVHLDWGCPRESLRVLERGGASRLCASGFPRPIPGVPPQANLKGISFAVANATGLLARLREVVPSADVSTILALVTDPQGPSLVASSYADSHP